jgi:hypothetical protein
MMIGGDLLKITVTCGETPQGNKLYMGWQEKWAGGGGQESSIKVTWEGRDGTPQVPVFLLGGGKESGRVVNSTPPD